MSRCHWLARRHVLPPRLLTRRRFLPQHIGVTTYVFKIVMEKSQLWLHAAGLSPRLPTRQQHFRVFHGSPPPEWFPDEARWGRKGCRPGAPA